MSHQNVIKYFEHFLNTKKLFIVYEYCEVLKIISKIYNFYFVIIIKGGNLDDYLRRKPLDKGQLLNWFKQIVEGLKYLHSNKIHHRDLKSRLINL